MKALSLKQPWAWLMVNGIKDIENRKWRSNFRGRLLIHASKTWDQDGYEYVKFHTMDSESQLPSEKDEYTFGAIIGRVSMVDCVDHHPSKWFFGPWGFIFESPKVFEDPIPYRGQVRIFDIPDRILREL